MEQHPIPQNISSYQFRLVGDMTIKQFFYVAGGAIISLILYSLNIHPVIKWPLILFSFGFGLALAFVPFQERPLSIWVISFFSSIYSPTVYFWQKTVKEPKYFSDDAPIDTLKTDYVAPRGEKALEEYLQVLPNEGQKETSDLDKQENTILAKINELFNLKPGLPKDQVREQAIQIPVNEEHKLEEVVQNPAIASPSANNQGVNQTPPISPEEDRVTNPVTPNIPGVSEIKPTSTPPQIVRPKIIVEESPPGPIYEQPINQYPPISISEKQSAQLDNPIVKAPTVITPPITTPAVTPPPFPTIPNTIAGIVVDFEGNPLEGIIMDIRNKDGKSVRLIRTNKNGNFITVTSLINGTYNIYLEKEGFEFDTVEFDATGQIIPSMIIKSKPQIKSNESPALIN